MSAVGGTVSIRPQDRTDAGPTLLGVVVGADASPEHVGRCLESIRVARQALPPWVECRVAVAHGCLASSREAVDALLAQVPAVSGSDCADDAWLACAEASCTVPADWLAAQHSLACDGAVLVTTGAGSLGLRLDAYRCVESIDEQGPVDQSELLRRLRVLGVLPVAGPSVLAP